MALASGLCILLAVCISPSQFPYDALQNRTVSVVHPRVLTCWSERPCHRSRLPSVLPQLLYLSCTLYLAETAQTHSTKPHLIRRFLEGKIHAEKGKLSRAWHQPYCRRSTVDIDSRQPRRALSHLFPSMIPSILLTVRAPVVHPDRNLP